MLLKSTCKITNSRINYENLRDYIVQHTVTRQINENDSKEKKIIRFLSGLIFPLIQVPDKNKIDSLITMTSANCWPELHKKFDSFA